MPVLGAAPVLCSVRGLPVSTARTRFAPPHARSRFPYPRTLPRTPGRFAGSACSAHRLFSSLPARNIRPPTAWAQTPLPGAGTWKPTFAHAHNLGSRAALPMCTVGLLTAPGAGPAGCGHIEDGTCPLRVLPEMHKPNNNRPNKNRRDKVWTMKGLARAKAG